jgi:hypothetical protein
MPLKRDKIVVSRTYLPLNPEEYPANMPMNSENEHDERTPVFAYDAKNVLPRSSGYSSFFGQQKTVGTDPLPARIDHVFVFKSPEGDNVLLGLGEDGVYSQFGDGSTPPASLAGGGLEGGAFGDIP